MTTAEQIARSGPVDIRVAGELDLAAAGSLRTRVEEALVTRPRSLRVSLADVTFLDCAGLGELLACRRRARRSGVRLTVTSASRPVLRLLQLTDTTQLLVGAADQPPGMLP